MLKAHRDRMPRARVTAVARRASTLATRADVLDALPRALFDAGSTLERANSTEKDRGIGEAQLGRAAKAAIGAASRCAHGAPRAYLYGPLRASRDGADARAEHGTSRLACPMLCDEVKAWERRGGLTEVAREVDRRVDLREGLIAAHEDAPRLRNWLLGEELGRRIREDAERDGEESAAGRVHRIINETGVVGVTLSDVREVKTWKIVKCLHAQLADFFVRGREKNPVGALVFDTLIERGVRVDGTEDCARRCNL